MSNAVKFVREEYQELLEYYRNLSNELSAQLEDLAHENDRLRLEIAKREIRDGVAD